MGAVSTTRPRYVGDVPHDRQVVRDEEQAHAQLASQTCQQVGHLRLSRCVERRERLVQDDHRWFGGKGAGDGDALALAATVLVRESLRGGPRKPHLLQKIVHTTATFASRREAEDVHRIGDLVSDAAARVERAERVLKNHLQARVDSGSGPPSQRVDRTTFERHGSGRRRLQADRYSRQGRLPAAGLAHKPHDLAGVDRQAGSRDSAHRCTPRAPVLDLDVAELQQAHAGTINGSTGQASRRRSPTSSKSGTSVLHEAIAYEQRG